MPEEFEEFVLNAKKVPRSRSSNHPIVFGPTSTGKFLACVFEYTGPDRIEVLPVTAFEVDE